MGSDCQKIEWGPAKLLKENHKKMVFDATAFTFLDSSGIGILMMCHVKLSKTGGVLRIAGAEDRRRNICDYDRRFAGFQLVVMRLSAGQISDHLEV
jgi:hypothetical protein